MNRHVNIPLFIPHMGCLNQCVFCNQHIISGACSFSMENVRKTIDSHLATILPRTECEIAFFGGSFTGIDREWMQVLLSMAQEYVRAGAVHGIRLSTRPDYITPEIVSILLQYSVCAVELGVQSMSDMVLKTSRRGHTAASTVQAAALLRTAGIPWVGQMMIGLPDSSPAAEAETAVKICEMGACACRIYPTLVFQDTELAEWTRQGTYVPLCVEDAVRRCAACLEIFHRERVECLRIGLCDSEMLHTQSACIGGPVDPAIGERVGARLYRNRMEKALDRLQISGNLPERVTIFVPKGDLSMAKGQKKENEIYLKNRYPVKSVIFLEKAGWIRYNIQLGI